MKKILICGCLMILGLGALWAETFTHQEGGISIWFPNHWRVNTDGNILDAEAPSQDAFAQLIVLKDARSLQEGVDAYIKKVKRNIKRFAVTRQGDQVRKNGLTFYYVWGEGMMNGIDVGTGAAIIQTPKAIVLMMTLDTEQSRKHHRKQIKNIMNSIRALR